MATNTQSLQGFQAIMQKHEELRQAFAILRQAIDKAETEFSQKYERIIQGIQVSQTTDAQNMAKIANSFVELSKSLDSLKQ